MIAQARKASLPPAIPVLHHLDGAIPPPEDDGEENDATMVEPAPFDGGEPSAPTHALSGGAHGEMPQIAFPPIGARPATTVDGAFNPFEGGTFMPLGDNDRSGAAPLVTSQQSGPWVPFVTQPGYPSGEAPPNPFGATQPRMDPAPGDLRAMRTVTSQAVGHGNRNRNLLLAGAITACVLFISAIALFFAFRSDGKPRPDGRDVEVKAMPSGGSAGALPVPSDLASAGGGPFVSARKAFSGVLAVATPPTVPPGGGIPVPAPEPLAPEPTAAPPVPIPDPPVTAAPKAPDPPRPDPPRPDPPRPDPKRPPTPNVVPPAPVSGGTGQLSIVCLPGCADISDNGSSLGGGPIFGRTVPAGRHSIKLVSTSSPPVIKSMTITVKTDQKTEIRQSMVQ